VVVVVLMAVLMGLAAVVGAVLVPLLAQAPELMELLILVAAVVVVGVLMPQV
jgi:hypothetical protein